MTLPLKDRLAQDMTAAMKARDGLRTDVLRMAKTAITNREIEKRAALDEAEVVGGEDVLQRAVDALHPGGVLLLHRSLGTPRADLPGVGRNLQDHLMIPMCWRQWMTWIAL